MTCMGLLSLLVIGFLAINALRLAIAVAGLWIELEWWSERP